jgi:uncharacterized membrane protein YhaH (DUF805 family)
VILNVIIDSLALRIIGGIWIFGGQVLPLIALVVKRLHDLNSSGCLVGLGCIPFVGLVLLIPLGILKGTEGPNAYGPDPLQKDGFDETRSQTTNN